MDEHQFHPSHSSLILHEAGGTVEMQAHVRPSGDHAGVEVIELVGELCTESVPCLERSLVEWLDHSSAERVVIDLGEVTFIDCRGLTLLLTLRERTTRQILQYHRPSACVARLLEICELRSIIGDRSVA